MFSKILIVLTFIIPITSLAAIYSWTDKNGIIHFTDEPRQNIILVEKKPKNIARTSSVIALKIVAKTIIREIAITAPKNEETIQYDDGKLTVNIAVILNPNDKIILLVDGKPITASHQTTFNLKNIERGEHTLQAQLFAQNKLIGESKITTFFMHHTAT